MYKDINFFVIILTVPQAKGTINTNKAKQSHSVAYPNIIK